MLVRARHDSPITPNTGGGTPDYFDIGAHEFKGYFVNDETGDDTWNGLYAIHHGGSDGPKKRIQPAINTTVSGDAVVVAPGIYKGEGNRDLSFGGREITLLSNAGPQATVIDCEADSSDEHRGLTVSAGEGPDAVFKGFSIVNGYVAQTGSGGGIYIGDSYPTILDCKVENCYARYGGAIQCARSSPTIVNCVLNDNHALTTLPNTGSGGAMEIYYGDPIVKNCLITNNTADLYGGGLLCYAGVPQISNCTVFGNTAASYGGGIFIQYEPDIRDCIVWNNSPESVYVWMGSPDITYSDIQGGTGQPWFGTGCIDSSPYFVVGPLHNFYLCHSDLQGIQSPCVDAGSTSAQDLGLGELTTRTDGDKDTGTIDMGYHALFLLRITAIYPSGNDVVIEWNARDLEVYTVQWSTDMENWNDVYVGETDTWTDVGGMYSLEKYYRVREE
jgi:hypothetical protein